jgi:hypothetical protein
MNQPKKILILSANPKDTARLRLDEQVREIEEGLRRSKCRDQFEIHSKWAVRMRDLRRTILDSEPQIVHFCGYGEEDGLKVEDEKGNTVLVPPHALSGLFELFAGKIECVLLNACYSEVQARAMSEHINYVIGMSHGIRSEAAIEFAVGFYDALGAGKPVEEAFKFGRNAIQLYNIPGHLAPLLLGKKIVSPQPPTPPNDTAKDENRIGPDYFRYKFKMLERFSRNEGPVPRDNPVPVENKPGKFDIPEKKQERTTGKTERKVDDLKFEESEEEEEKIWNKRYNTYNCVSMFFYIAVNLFVSLWVIRHYVTGEGFFNKLGGFLLGIITAVFLFKAGRWSLERVSYPGRDRIIIRILSLETAKIILTSSLSTVAYLNMAMSPDTFFSIPGLLFLLAIALNVRVFLRLTDVL